MTPYDQLEAITIFTRSRPPANAAEEQAEASTKLIAAVVSAAVEAGLEAAKVGLHQATITGEQMRAHLTDGGARGWPLIASHPVAKPNAELRWSRIEGIEYDPEARLFVGVAEDPSHVAAGSAPQRRSAVAIVAEAVVAVLATASGKI